ncbi:MAG: DUF2272 domain-containing protein, partial [Pseudomonadota bacterium]
MKHVASRSLNLRTEPLIKPSMLIVGLPFGHPVTIEGPSTREGWHIVSTSYQGRDLRGHISGRFLRDPASDKIELTLAMGAVEWDRFERGAGKEHINPFAGFVGEMWKELPGFQHLTGKDRGVPWSAACISFIIRNAGYQNFQFSAAHARYINESIVARLDNDTSKDFWGFRLNEHKPQLGDLVCRKRTSANIDYDFAARHNQFKSHTDIVVSIGDDEVYAVGG